jgi:hypothetical protein
MLDYATEVLVMAEAIALRLGTDEGYHRVYRDSGIQIRRAMHSREMEITIFPPFTGVKTGNPAVMLDETGKMFRWHGEMYNARNHIRDIYRRIKEA